jgi:hypothetical protein
MSDLTLTIATSETLDLDILVTDSENVPEDLRDAVIGFTLTDPDDLEFVEITEATTGVVVDTDDAENGNILITVADDITSELAGDHMYKFDVWLEYIDQRRQALVIGDLYVQQAVTGEYESVSP